MEAAVAVAKKRATAKENNVAYVRDIVMALTQETGVFPNAQAEAVARVCDQCLAGRALNLQPHDQRHGQHAQHAPLRFNAVSDSECTRPFVTAAPSGGDACYRHTRDTVTVLLQDIALSCTVPCPRDRPVYPVGASDGGTVGT